MTTLDQLLSRAYAAQHGLSKESLATVMVDFNVAAAYDPTLVSLAKLRLGAMTDAICDRDHISAQYRNFLRLVLEPT